MWFKRRKKEEFINRLKYGRKEKINYSAQGVADALTIGDEETAKLILEELVNREIKSK